MSENLNELIEINLKLLNESSNKSLFRTSFVDEKGRQLNDSLRLAKNMHDRSLIKLEPLKEYRCDLEEFGFKVYNQGGWIKHLQNEKTKSDFISEKELLDFEKSKVDLELAKKMLKEYPYTKWFARIGFVIALILMLLEMSKW